ncbi:hypothetical protein OA866_00755 [bacterium]|nr:hypothetical protein [bacterium]
MWKEADRPIPLEWHNIDIPLTNIITRNFCLPKALPHYSFCEAFFLEGTSEALAKSRYANWYPVRHTDYFINYPNQLKREPVWWELPWGGYNKLNLDISLKELKRLRIGAMQNYWQLLKSIKKHGFSFEKGPSTPVQLLVDNGKYVCIQQGSHHRLAALEWLFMNQMHELLQEVQTDYQSMPFVPCNVTLILNREDVPYLDSVGNSKGQFSERDALSWFDLAISLVNNDRSVYSETNFILNSIDKMVSCEG